MWPFNREHAFLLGLSIKAKQTLLHHGLQWFVAYFDLNLSRCQYKRVSSYKSWSDFIDRRVDPIWHQERWSRCEFLRPCEGAPFDHPCVKHMDFFNHTLPIPFHVIAAIERSAWDVCWLRAPIDLTLIQEANSWRIYQSTALPFYFCVRTSNPSILKTQVKAGEEMGRLSGESAVYMIERGVK